MNPYQSPEQLGPADVTNVADREKLRRIAKYQRLVLVALNCNLTIFAVGAVNRIGDKAMALTFLAFWLLVVAFQLPALYLLATELSSFVIAILSAVLMLFPCVSLVILFAFNQKAISILKAEGLAVGFFGVDPDTI